LLKQFCLNSFAENLSAKEQQIIAQVRANFNEQLSFLEKSVNINSGTRNLAGVKKVGALYKNAFEQLGMKTTWIDLPKKVKRAGHLLIESTNANSKWSSNNRTKNDGNQNTNIMLIGHLDTVFPKTSKFQTYISKGDIAKGPGVTDMKDGNSIILYSLKALKQQNSLQNATVRVILNGDEESVGRPITDSRAPMIAIAKKSDVALSFESGGKDYASIARRGTTGWTLKVKAKRSHSSGIFSDGTGAGSIFETARILNSFYAQIRGEQGLTFSPGIIAGGTEVKHLKAANSYSTFGKSNIIPQQTIVKGDIRFISNEQRESVKQRMKQIVALNLPKTKAEISFRDGYPAMPSTQGNKSLLKLFNQVSQDLGYSEVAALPAAKRGAGDAAFVSPYVDVIDGLGASGRGSHTPREQLSLKSLQMATERTAIFIYRLAHQSK